MLSYPLYPYSYKKGDVRLDDRIEPRLRAAMFDHNQVVRKITQKHSNNTNNKKKKMQKRC